MARKLFCEISPACYKISVEKSIAVFENLWHNIINCFIMIKT